MPNAAGMALNEVPGKVDAIYELREAAEQKAHAERDLADVPTPETRDALLDAQLKLEEKTVEAIEVCHECGHEHGPAEAHVEKGGDNVVRVSFGSGEEQASN